MLMPKKAKWRKQSRAACAARPRGGDMVSFGEYGLKALEPGWITSRQIEAVRVTISRTMSKTGKMWIRVFPDKPITKKPAETRMGKGKGAPEGWVAVVKPGRVMFELSGVPIELAKEAFQQAIRFAIKTKFVERVA